MKKNKKIVRKYPKVYGIYNYKDELNLDKLHYIQEKLDGSNISIIFNKNEKSFKTYSRNQEIKKDSENFKTIFDFLEKNIKDLNIFDIIDIKDAKEIRLHGEWLKQSKLSYNNTHANTFWLFDISYKDNDGIKYFLPFNIVKIICKKIGLNIIPHFNEKITIKEFLKKDIKDKYIKNKKTLIEFSDSLREGVVLKAVDGSQMIKFVSDEFKENIHRIKKNKNQKDLIIIDDSVMTDARIDKYIVKLKEKDKLPNEVDLKNGKNIKIIFQNLEMLNEDLFEEELDNLIEILKKQIKKSTGRNVKNYIKRKLEEIK